MKDEFEGKLLLQKLLNEKIAEKMIVAIDKKDKTSFFSIIFYVISHFLRNSERDYIE